MVPGEYGAYKGILPDAESRVPDSSGSLCRAESRSRAHGALGGGIPVEQRRCALRGKGRPACGDEAAA